MIIPHFKKEWGILCLKFESSQHTGVSTYHNPSKADPQAKTVVRASTSPTREKLFFKTFFPSKNFKNANIQPDRKTFGKLVAKLNTDKSYRTRKAERQGITRALQKWRCGASYDKFFVNLKIGTSYEFSGENRHLRKARNRWLQC